MKPAIYQGKKIRRIWNDKSEKWYFSVVDWSDLKIKLGQEGGQVYEKIVQLKMEATDKNMRETDAADTETMFRIIQSIPSPKAEPFKQMTTI